MTSRTVDGTTYTLTYDHENRLTGVTGGGSTYTFVYDGDGGDGYIARVKLIAPSDTIVYIGKYLEKTSTNEKIYYYEGGARVAMRTVGTLYYLLTDQLGSSTAALKADGTQYGKLLYSPWGEVRYTTGSVPTSARYTGQRDPGRAEPSTNTQIHAMTLQASQPCSPQPMASDRQRTEQGSVVT